MSAAFTPGPWRSVASKWPSGHRCIIDADGIAIAHTVERGNDEANARLIAAAPELDALAEKADAFARSVLTSDPASSTNIEANALIEEIRRVRAKARGGQDATR